MRTELNEGGGIVFTAYLHTCRQYIRCGPRGAHVERTNADAAVHDHRHSRGSSRGWQTCCRGPAGQSWHQSRPSQKWLGTLACHTWMGSSVVGLPLTL
jgi:hypothetical protein